MGTPALLLGFGAATFFVASSFPQAVKVWRSGSAHGVNVTSWVLLFGLVCTWLGYGLRSGNPTLLMAQIGGITSCGIVLLAIARSRGTRLWLAVLGMIGLGGGLTAAALAVPLPVLAAVFLLGTVIPWMQPVTSFRTWRSHDTSNVSIATFVLRALTQAAWLGQCIFTRDPILAMTATITLTAVLCVIGLEVMIAGRQSPAQA